MLKFISKAFLVVYDFVLEENGNEKRYELQKPLRFVVENGVIKEIGYAEFVKINKGAQW